MRQSPLAARPALIIATLFVALAPAAPARSQDDGDAASDREEYLHYYGVLAEAVAQIEQNYAAPVGRQRLFEAALRGMMDELDPYSRYIPPGQLDKYRNLGQGSKLGVGVELAIEQGRVVLLAVRPDSPAHRAGLAPGERVVSIDGHATEGMTLARADELLAAGGLGESVEVVVADDGGAERTVELRVERATGGTVVARRLINGRVGYVRLASFGADTASDLRSALAGLRDEGAQGFVIDLRFNAGGLLEAAVDVADLFLNSGVIVSVEGRNAPRRTWRAEGGDVIQGAPLTALVNRYSASASEVVAAALQDNGRALVAGARTWGKGSVQNIFPLADGASAVKLTTASYMRPNGENINRFAGASEQDAWGVSPDEGLAAPLADDQAKSLLRAWREDGSDAPQDPQLELAVERIERSLKGSDPRP